MELNSFQRKILKVVIDRIKINEQNFNNNCQDRDDQTYYQGRVTESRFILGELKEEIKKELRKYEFKGPTLLQLMYDYRN